jgi:hypothetical protein
VFILCWNTCVVEQLLVLGHTFIYVITDVILYWFQTFSNDFDVSVFIWHPLYHIYQFFLYIYVPMCLYDVVVALHIEKCLKF